MFLKNQIINIIFTIAVFSYTMMSFAQNDSIRDIVYEKGFELEYSNQLGSWAGQVGEPGGLKFDAHLAKPVKSVKLMFVNGVRFEYLFLGVGIGLDYAKWDMKWRTLVGSMDNNEYSVSMPLFARFKLLFSPKEFSPFLNLDLGGNILIASIWKPEARNHCYRNSGLIVKPGLGLNISFESGKQLYLVLEYDYNYIPNNQYYNDHGIHSIGSKVGFLF